MNAALAKNVRTIRKHKNWTQQHLADLAGIQLPTLQRIENAEGASAETLSALAAGLDLPVEILQTDVDKVLRDAQDERANLEKSHVLIRHAHLQHWPSRAPAVSIPRDRTRTAPTAGRGGTSYRTPLT
jgi:transcriptional regulator with XRE-family HTH domain